LHQSGAIGSLAGNQNIATQACEVGGEIFVDAYWPQLIECYRLEEGPVLGAEGAQILWDDKDAFGILPLDDI
jgi:hypothetical protein